MDNPVKFMGVQSHQLALAWPQVRGYVLAALEHGQGEFDEEAVYEGVAAGEMQMWLLWREIVGSEEVVSVAVTQLLEFPTRTVLELLLLGGEDFESWKDQISVLEAWGLERGARELRWMGRPGFEKRMVPLGYRKRYVVFSKHLGVLH